MSGSLYFSPQDKNYFTDFVMDMILPEKLFCVISSSFEEKELFF
ncbi:hypothetical protein ACFSFZ_01930 [Mixta tenebrionis]|nr:hypothetical protein [Mixta tenebrionis]